jgi:sterol desaturase/sphingolipid hydroxylase (fatty acid hydroxylase superfamily)
MELGRLLVIAVLPATVVASLAEAWVLCRYEDFDWKALGVSVLNFAVRNIVLVALPLSIVSPVFRWAWEHRVTTLRADSWASVVLLFLGQELCYYWFHRASHRVRWFWANHAIHHSPNQLNLSASLRSAVFGRLAGEGIFFVPLVWIGFAPKLVFLALAFNLLYQTWIHTTWIPKLGWFEFIFNTPSAHRVHHAANLEYLDANYGGVLILFDRMFGTYIAERSDLPCRYGWVHPQTSHNPFRVEFEQWLSLFRDLVSARRVGAFVGYLFRPPGWRPSGRGETTEELRRFGRVSGTS